MRKCDKCGTSKLEEASSGVSLLLRNWISRSRWALFSSGISSLGYSGVRDNKLRHIYGDLRILILIFLEAAINCDSMTIDKYQYSIEGRGSPILRKVICKCTYLAN